MAGILNFQMVDQLKHFRAAGAGKEARLPVLLYLVLRANAKLRCWPSVDTIAADTGIGKPRVVEALGWLAEKGAFCQVPSDLRLGAEKHLRANQHVYQLTGVINLADQPVPYLFLSPEVRAALLMELARLGASSLVDMLEGSLTVPVSEANGTDSVTPIGTENEPEGGEIGTDSDSIELESYRTSSTEPYLSAPSGADEGAASRVDNYVVEEAASRDAPKREQEPPPSSGTPPSSHQALFGVVCRRGFRLDPQQLPRDPKTGQPTGGGRIGKVVKAMRRLYPQLTATQLEAMYDAYFRALPNVQYLKSVPLTVDYLVEFMQTGTIRAPIATQSRDKQQPETRIIDRDFDHPRNAKRAYLKEDLALLDLPPGFREWLETNYWTQRNSNVILGSVLVRGIARFEREGVQHGQSAAMRDL